MSVFLSTPSARRATQGLEQYNRHNQNFYPRPLRGGRLDEGKGRSLVKAFLSTPSARRATGSQPLNSTKIQFLSTPSARRATLASRSFCTSALFLSTPSARRATGATIDRLHRAMKFLSTPSARRATPLAHRAEPHPAISIHALCEEGDGLMLLSKKSLLHFYPRPLRGGRHPQKHRQRQTV